MQVLARLVIKNLLLAFFALFFFPSFAIAETTPFRSASTVTTNTIGVLFTNLDNCSATDGLTCDRPFENSNGNLYFRNFGDFGIPNGSTITNVRIRVTGKSSFGHYVGVSAGTTYVSGCQLPSDRWATFGGTTIYTHNFSTPISNGTLASCLSLSRVQNNTFTWRINYSSGSSWSANIDNFEIAFDYNLAPTPTPTITATPTQTPTPTLIPSPTPTMTPTPTATPTPAGPEPFLDLPWDYEGDGKSFEDVVLDPFSWFDHQYPLQNFCCDPPVMIYTGETKNKFYRSHNGYDYALKNGVELNTPVLAAASGEATLKLEAHSGGAGNVIKIDHGNGYQTWYEHLSIDDLIATDSAHPVEVAMHQQIGKVGMTGNTNGPHIHFSVFKDANDNDNFDDDIPYGVVDPLGWEGSDIDPWATWTSNERTGTKSFNLFIARAPAKSVAIAVDGGSLNTDKVNITIPSGAFLEPFHIIFKNGPFESASDLINSVVPSFFLNAFDSFGESVTQFIQPVTIDYDYSGADLSNINEETLKLYFLNEETNEWDPLSTILDTTTKTASAQTTHFSHFALMGEVKDLIAPTTEVTIIGDKGQDNWYRSNVTVELRGTDNEGGIGLQYTLYTLNDTDWLVYENPLIFDQEGSYKITYQSFDKADNKGERKTIEFKIDKTMSTVFIDANPKTLWPPNGKMVDILVTGSALDENLYTTNFSVEDEYNRIEPVISGFGQTIQLEAKRDGVDIDGRIYILKVVAEDLAGNKTEKQVQVVVPHDQGKKK